MKKETTLEKVQDDVFDILFEALDLKKRTKAEKTQSKQNSSIKNTLEK